MIYILTICIFIATLLGSIAGLGGGIILKPLIDLMGIYSVSTTNFISGSAVFAMSVANTAAKKKLNPQIPVFTSDMTAVAIGSAAGGLIGNEIFSLMVTSLGEKQSSILQTVILLIINAAILFFTLRGLPVQYNVRSIVPIFLLGLGIGSLSAFLGIGGGPVNIILLQMIMGLEMKRAVDYSLCMILFAQGTSFLITLFSGILNTGIWRHGIIYIFAGIAGGIAGRSISNKVPERIVRGIYIFLILLVIFIIILTMVSYIV